MKNRRLAVAIAAGLVAVLVLACSGLPGRVASVTPTPTKTPRPIWTATLTPTITPVPSNTALPTSTPVPPTETPSLPTALATVAEITATVGPPTAEPTDVPSDTPPPATVAPTRPKATKTPAPPTKTPAPKVDFKVVEQKLVPKAQNEAGLHSFFIRVIDAAGNPLHDISVWDPSHPDQTAITGTKPDPYSAEYQMWSTDAYYLEVKNARSEKTKGLSTDRPKVSNADLIAAGYCTDDNDCNLNVHAMHFSWFVTFQRTW